MNTRATYEAILTEFGFKRKKGEEFNEKLDRMELKQGSKFLWAYIDDAVLVKKKNVMQQTKTTIRIIGVGELNHCDTGKLSVSASQLNQLLTILIANFLAK